MEIITFKKIGGLLTVVPIVGLVIFLLYINIADNTPTTRVTFSIFSSAIFCSLIGCLLSGEIMMKGGVSPYTRSKTPAIYWFAVTLQLLLALLLLSFALK